MINTLLYIHIICAFTSLALLIIRGGMQLTGRDWRAIKVLKILPHLSDTLLIISGITLLIMSGLGITWWAVTKFILILLYAMWASEFLHKEVKEPKLSKFILACLSLIIAILLGYFHSNLVSLF
ncbi:putative membrane protein SirB2 [Bisgaardia hudsonensis]|uniref:Putative membrane protein SirB2 n=1 Tax=Bisgaardia hudsonensis TaxID=109472 RepID=A0A4R2N2I7_9PAST|nr:SirB2 family protein [Bisgaardia hudsonensis]QLB12537.1 hypothetical protein A6A11_02425 [Bisgaardia hudsonensis]TCP14078.1 putative membrane protein SirB2 [Bisgaardia hudsonensis]